MTTCILASQPVVRMMMVMQKANGFLAMVFILQVVAMSCVLGIAIDLVTAHVAIEYFTIHHPHVVDSDSPIVIAIVWGIGASWWCGLIVAPVLWWVNARRNEPLSTHQLLVLSAKAMVLIWLIMMVVLLGIYLISGMVPFEQRSSHFESDRRLMSVAVTHSIEYVLAVAATLLCIRKLRSKR